LLRARRYKRGSVRYDKRRGTWNYLWYESGQRRSKLIGTRQQYPTKAAAWKAVESIPTQPRNEPHAVTVKTLVEHYREEKMPARYSTRRGYNAWLNNHVLPRWGTYPITEVRAMPVELWLKSLELSPKSLAAIRGLLRILWEFAMWRGDIPVQRNPMELVRIKDATKRKRQPRSLTVQEFQIFIGHLGQPFRTMALVCVCFGLRISECLALKWSDVDWLSSKLYVRRGIVRQRVGETKTEYSNRPLAINNAMVEVLKGWKQTTQFSGAEDWIFASPAHIGRLPWSHDAVCDAYVKAAKAASIGHVSTHTMRHTYRSWLDAVGTPVAVQQKLMRHADIRTTMNVYGDVVTDEMQQAHSKVVSLALNGAQTERKPS
jgi:integrase